MKKFLFTVGALLLFVTLNAALPPVISIRCGKLDFKLSNYQSWNLSEINFNKVNVCRNISYFGNVAMFKINGKDSWVGSGHKDNGKKGETDVKVQFFADGKEFTPDKKIREVTEFELKKSSVLLDLKIEYTLKVKDSEIYEHAKITVLRDNYVRLLYLFMHPWCPIFTRADFDFGNGKIETVELAGKRALSRPKGAMSATYYAPEQKFITTTHVKAIKPFYNGEDNMFHLWNRGDKHDRKLYFQAVSKRNMKAGESGEYEAVTRFFISEK